MNILKGQYATDVFTTQAEARVRSMELGLDGVTHVYDYDGQAVYMPAASHEAYMAFMGGYTPEMEEASPVDRLEALRAIVAEVIGKSMTKNIEGKILKTDDEQRIQSDREGWVVAYKVFDDDVWAMVKSGELAAFSIGGKAIKEEI